MHKAVIVVLCLLFGACTKLPDSISGLPVAIPNYGLYSCKRLVEERAVVVREIRVAMVALELGVDGFAAGISLLGLPFHTLAEREQRTLVGIARLRVQEINAQALKRGCRETDFLTMPSLVDASVVPVTPGAPPTTMK